MIEFSDSTFYMVEKKSRKEDTEWVACPIHEIVGYLTISIMIPSVINGGFICLKHHQNAMMVWDIIENNQQTENLRLVRRQQTVTSLILFEKTGV